VLRKYYSAISDDERALLYILALVLNSHYKLTLFSKSEWQREEEDSDDY